MIAQKNMNMISPKKSSSSSLAAGVGGSSDDEDLVSCLTDDDLIVSTKSSTFLTTTAASTNQSDRDRDLDREHWKGIGLAVKSSSYNSNDTIGPRSSVKARNSIKIKAVAVDRLNSFFCSSSKTKVEEVGRGGAYATRSRTLYGRDDEIQILKQAFLDVRTPGERPSSSTTTRTTATTTSQRLILVAGKAGTGKTTLVRTALSHRSMITSTPKNAVMSQHGSASSSSSLSSSFSSSGATSLDPPLVCCGKFEQQLRFGSHCDVAINNEPFSAIVVACNELNYKIVSDPTLNGPIRKMLRVEFHRQEVETLTRLIPSLSLLLSEHQDDDDDDDINDDDGVNEDEDKGGDTSKIGRRRDGDDEIETTTTSSGNSRSEWTDGGIQEHQNRLRYAVQRYLRVVANFFASGQKHHVRKVVLWCDDLQFADDASVELLHVLATDRLNPNLLVVGCYRDDEVDQDHSLYRHILSKYAFSDDGDNSNKNNESYNVLQLHIGNMDIHQITQMLVALLNEDQSDETLLDLASVVMTRTGGNPFYTIQFIRSLVDQQLLNYSVASGRWTYDPSTIRRQTTATENVVELLSVKLHSNLPAEVAKSLPCMALLGTTFKRTTASIIMQSLGHDDDFLDQMLDLCEEEGILEAYDEAKALYGFLHDKIQESLLLQHPPDDMERLKFRLGIILMDLLPRDELDSNLFVVATLLGTDMALQSTELDAARKTSIAKISLQAGMKAMKTSGFASAANFLRKGIAFLPTERWEDPCYHLTMDMYSSAAEAEYCTGNFDRMQTYCDEALAQKSRPLLDKRRIYTVLLESLGARDRMKEAEALSLNVLSELNCRFPKRLRLCHTIIGITKLKLSTKKQTPEQISGLARMTDESHIWTMELLDKLFTYCYIGQSDLLPLVAMKSLQWTIQYGTSEFSSPAFALIGLLTCSIGDVKTGRVYGDHAIRLLKQTPSRGVESRVMFLTNWFNLPWTKDVHSCLKPLEAGYHVGMKSGDITSAMWCIFCYLEITFHTGRNLENLLTDMKNYTDQMREVKQTKQLFATIILYQLVQNVAGRSTSEPMLSGPGMDEARKIQESGGDAWEPIALRYKLHSAFYFGDYQWFVETISAKGFDYIEKALPAVYALGPFAFHCALSCFSLARQSTTRKKKEKLIRMANAFRKRIKGWVENGDPNVTHYESLLDAEMAYFSKKNPVAVKNYKVAILLSGRQGYVNDRALCHERFGEFHLFEGDKDEAKYQMEQAVDLYREWGALGKVRHLKAKHKALFSHIPAGVCTSIPFTTASMEY